MSSTNVKRERDSEEESSGLGLGTALVVGLGLGIGAAIYSYFSSSEPERAPQATQRSQTRDQTCHPQPTWHQQRRETFNHEDHTYPFRARSGSIEICLVCHEALMERQEVMILPCLHKYHQPCILDWVKDNKRCPCCRTAVPI